MGIEVISEFIAKATVRTIAYIYNDAGVLVDPLSGGSIKISIWDPDGGDPVVDGIAMTKQDSVTGVYEYYYKTTASSKKGWWRGEVDVIDGTGEDAKTSIGNFSFRIK